jgi:hypothetical protein
MSIECAECERDLRGGHDPSCSRHRYCTCGHGQSSHDFENDGDCCRCECREYRPTTPDNTAEEG